MDTFVYIDGFNLYYSIRQTGFKWLNIKRFSELLLGPGYNVIRIKYYTAHVSGATDPAKAIRQQTYLRAIQTIPEVQVFFGKFLSSPIWRPAINVPIAGRVIAPAPGIPAPGLTIPGGTYAVGPLHAAEAQEYLPIGQYGAAHNRPMATPVANAIKVRVHNTQEKGSDVNLAVHLLNDAWKNSFQAAAVISNDTDLAEPIRIATQELGKHVALLCTASRGASAPLANVATTVRHMHANHPRDAQLTDPVIPPQPGWKVIPKPPEW